MAHQEWNTTGKPEAETGNAYSTAFTRLKNGIKTALANYCGTSDPSGGGTWTSDQIGTLWFDETNEIDAAGDDLGGSLKIYETQTATPTLGFTDLKLRRIQAVSPTTNILSGSTAQNVAFTDIDISGSTTSNRALAAVLQIEVKADSPGAGVFFAVRKNGVTTDSLTRRVYPQVTGISVQQQIKVELDADQIFEWSVTCSATFAYEIDLLQYEERA